MKIISLSKYSRRQSGDIIRFIESFVANPMNLTKLETSDTPSLKKPSSKTAQLEQVLSSLEHEALAAEVRDLLLFIIDFSGSND
uniref:Uncharacterized protein n=1 Tax=uncultured Thiotrichaceae bacterium TaxID=298394 RepID=A0A6S6TQR5_9GAMM|nr:MAG: Unknown protein [uncultured Thiotrichaceae bacterium]